MTDKLREELAALCHEQWSGWMEYLFFKCEPVTPMRESGPVIIPVSLVDRWNRQRRTTYADLSNEEKESDRKLADRFLAVLEKGKN